MEHTMETAPIRKLPAEVIARIAAGEMISRPASMVKELVENALDAAPSRIGVTVREAVDRFLQVSDNGGGIARDELALALERHATSKIVREEDLLGIETLGFRGEALASIAEIARLTITSRREPDEHAWEIAAEGGTIGEIKAAARAPGTTVTVENLFYNTPVRKRFLKSGKGELKLAKSTLSAYALAAPGVGWSYTVDERTVFDLAPASDLRERLAQLHGPRVADGLLEIDGRERGFSLRGFVGVPELARAGSQHQAFFVNGRWVAAPWLGQAVRHGYGDLIPGHQNPWLVLFVVMPPDQVDVNLHPTKREVRFLDERAVFGSVQRAVHQAVARLLPRLVLGQTSPAVAPRSSAPASQGGMFDGLKQAARIYGGGSAGEDLVADAAAGGESPLTEGPAEGLVSLWQLHNRYVLAQTRKGLLIIDQHAAHERILYERIRERMARGDHGAQQILFPVVLELDEQQMDLLQDVSASLARMGFDLEQFSHNSVLVRGVPPLWRVRSEAELVRDLLDEAASMGLREGETIEGLARSFACRAAIKSGEPLSVEEMNRLVDELFATELPHGDPHGRPTFVFVSLRDLDQRFGRGGG